MKNNIIILFIAVLSVFACNKDDETSGKENNKKNEMRAKTITGHNEQWGDFKLEMYYSKNKLDSAFRYDDKGRFLGSLSIEKKDGVYTYNIRDFIHNIDADSIKRLDLALTEKHGAGTYLLEDSIPRIFRIRYSVSLINDIQTLNYYSPREDVGTGADFNNTYIHTKQEKIIYEYDNSGKILNSRAFVDIFDPINTTLYDRKIYKSEYIYNKNNVIKNNIYTMDSEVESSWRLIRELEYSNGENGVTAIQGANHDMELSYNGKNVSSITLNGITTKYEFNDKGYVTRINYANGDFMNIEYEDGRGDFFIFTQLDTQAKGFPIIK